MKIRINIKIIGLNNLVKPLFSTINDSRKRIVKTGARELIPGFLNHIVEKMLKIIEKIRILKSLLSTKKENEILKIKDKRKYRIQKIIIETFS